MQDTKLIQQVRGKKNILVVEEEGAVLYVLACLIEATEFYCNFDWAKDTNEAKYKIHKAVSQGRKFDLIIADVVLPRFDSGISLWKDYGADYKFILIAPTQYQEELSRFNLTSNAPIVIHKPIIQKECIKAVLSVLKDQPYEANMKKSPFGVMVVEDDPITLALISSIAVSMGAKNVIRCGNAHEAVKYMETHHGVDEPQLILSDVLMNNGDGIELLKEFHNKKQTGSHVPFYFVTGANPEVFLPQVDGYAFDGIIAKPVTIFKMKSVIQQAKKEFESA